MPPVLPFSTDFKAKIILDLMLDLILDLIFDLILHLTFLLTLLLILVPRLPLDPWHWPPSRTCEQLAGYKAGGLTSWLGCPIGRCG